MTTQTFQTRLAEQCRRLEARTATDPVEVGDEAHRMIGSLQHAVSRMVTVRTLAWRELMAGYGYNQSDIAREYGVSKQRVSVLVDNDAG